jgi:DNA-binding transcriptional ArsR family regulator
LLFIRGDEGTPVSRLLPLRTPVEREEGQHRVLSIDEDAADEVFAALSSETARTILSALYEEPRTASDLADVGDTSLQNVRYHLEKLRDAGLVEVVDTWYSSRGTEMKVYAPADASVVMFAGDEDTGLSLREALGRLVGGVGILGLASLAVERVFGPGVPDAENSPDVTFDGGNGTVTVTGETTEMSRTGAGETVRAPATTGVEGTYAERTTGVTTTGQESVTSGDTAGAETLTTTAREATDTAEQSTTAAANATNTATSVVDTTADTALDAVAGLSPGTAFFLGGLFVLLLALAWAGWRR